MFKEVPMSNIALKIGLVAMTATLFAACGSQPRNYYDSRPYDNGSSYRNRCETCGTVERVERVQVRERYNESQSLGGGAVLGAIIGGVVGSNIGHGDGRKVATVAGAVAGGVIGHEVQKSNSNDRRYRQDDYVNGYTIDVNLDDGRWAQVTQLDNPRLRAGNRVIIRNDQVYRLR